VTASSVSVATLPEEAPRSDAGVPDVERPAPGDRGGPDLMRWVRDAGSVVGIVTAAIGLVFVFLPDLKPDPSPVSSGAVLDLVSFDPDLTRGEYLARTDQGREGFTREELGRRGAFVLFSAELEGFKGKPLTLKREVIDRRTGAQVSEERAITITPPQNRVKRDWHYWVPLPEGGGSYRAVLQLLAEGEQAPLATLETDPFRGR
jgi:hypothetical protein